MVTDPSTKDTTSTTPPAQQLFVFQRQPHACQQLKVRLPPHQYGNTGPHRPLKKGAARRGVEIFNADAALRPVPSVGFHFLGNGDLGQQ